MLISAAAAQWVIDRIRQKWGPIVRSGAPTVSEFFAASASTESSGVSGSLCHIAGTAPAWTLSSGVLGVRVIDNRGTRQIRIRPRLGDLEWAEGRVPTTLGMVTLNHQTKEGRWRSSITLPDKTTGTIGLPETLLPDSIRVSGRPATPALEQGALWLPLPPGFSAIEGHFA